MLDQDINIALLNLFDLVKASTEYLNYRSLEKEVLKDYDLLMMINSHNDLMEQSNLSDDAKLRKRITELKQKINDNENYTNYVKSFDVYQKMIEDLSKIIFKDIINIVKEGEICAYQQW